MVKIMETPYVLMDDWEGKNPLFSETPICLLDIIDDQTAPRAQSSHPPMPVAQEQTMPEQAVR